MLEMINHEKFLKKTKLNKKELKELIDLLENASDIYYNTSEKILSDEDFDILKDLVEKHNVELKVGFTPRGNGVDVDHEYGVLVGTLGKANFVYEDDKDSEDKRTVESWYQNIKNEYDIEKLEISRKYDGNSVTLSYDKGKCIQALTRGRDGKGKDLTKFFKDNTIKYKGKVGIKYEAVISYKNFDYINENLLLDATYANPRSMTAGILGRLDGDKFSKYIDLIPLMMKHKDDSTTPREEQLKFFKKEFGNDNEFFKGFREIECFLGEELDEIKSIYNDYINGDREKLDYMIDGLVIQVLNPQETIDDLGYLNSKPKFAIALKFPYMEKESVVTDIEFDIGNTGRITPCVRFEPVYFNGARQDRISLANYKRFNELKLGKGSKVLIEYRNDTLSYCNKLDLPENDEIKPIPFIDHCPSCGEDIFINEKETFAFCVNPECDAIKIGKIERYLEKIDIKGIKENTIAKLYNNKLINTFLDLYLLTEEEIADVEGLGEITAKEIISAINNNQPYDYEVIAGSSTIADFGKTNAKTLLIKYSFYELLDITYNIYNKGDEAINAFRTELCTLEGFSKIKANKVVDGLLENYDFLAEVYENIDFREVKEEFKTDDVTYNIVFTGFRDEKIKKDMELRGHKIVLGGVSGKTDILVCMDPNENTVKLKKARDMGKTILSLDEFKAKFNL